MLHAMPEASPKKALIKLELGGKRVCANCKINEKGTLERFEPNPPGGSSGIAYWTFDPSPYLYVFPLGRFGFAHRPSFLWLNARPEDPGSARHHYRTTAVLRALESQRASI